MTIADRIKRARITAGRTQMAVAIELDVGLATVQRWEFGSSQPRAEHLVPLARALGVSVSWLLGESEGPYP